MMIGSSLIGLSRDEIHLWLASDQIDPAKAATYRLLLSLDERQQERRFRFDRDRARYLQTRALVRTVLSRYEPIDPKDWAFSVNPYGRPEIDETKTEVAGLCFNVSHTAGLIALAVARSRGIGIDVENIFVRESPLDVARQVFTAAELAECGRLPPEQQLDRFFQHWTFKESYIKARGMGVSLPLRKVDVRLERDGLVELQIAPDLSDDPARWQFWQLRPAQEYLLAICAEKVGQRSPDILVKRTTLGSEQDVTVQFDRVSA
ncbi:4'-phosphopantetheinyl transferase superfamily protein [Bradyrhizobium sp. UFLA01-814]|uniref:4'-phosphopantetheinyl transferase family protein n=1 Tax=Bradyrhizobium sp. UFLA01-814 TaxID=3023480 RepID=UPI00398A6F5F